MVGSLDLQKVLRDGEHAFSPGLLARAHGGVLYVDEVNLLHDHLVDVLLDAAAMGRVHVERDGVSHSHDARFVLIGTMNPEEGELRPQLLDRFGLTVDVRASRDVDVRVEVIRRRMDVRGRPAGVRRALRRRRRRAGPPHRRGPRGGRRRRVAGQRVAAHRRTVRGVRRRRHARRPGGGAHRGGARRVARRRDRRVDARRTSGSPPNWRCRTGVAATRSTIPGSIPNSSTRRWRQAGEPARTRTRARPRARSARRWRSTSGEAPDQAAPATAIRRSARHAAQAPRRRRRSGPRRWWCPGSGRVRRAGGRGPATGPGTTVSATDDPDAGHGVHLFGTLLAAARHGSSGRGRRLGRRPTTCGARFAKGREGNLVIFVVDASGSMAARDRMAAVGGADAVAAARRLSAPRQGRRHHLPRAAGAELVLPPTSSVHIASRRLARFDTGGKTPLAQGLLAARDVVVREKARDRARRSLVVVLTDGRATGGPDPLGRDPDRRGPAARPRAPPPSWWTARRPMCDWVWPRSWPASSGRPRFGWRSFGPTR